MHGMAPHRLQELLRVGRTPAVACTSIQHGHVLTEEVGLVGQAQLDACGAARYDMRYRGALNAGGPCQVVLNMPSGGDALRV